MDKNIEKTEGEKLAENCFQIIRTEDLFSVTAS